MADPTPTAAPNPTSVVPGTSIPVPVGSGVETLTPVSPPFRTNAPAWYTPPDANGKQSVWSMMGCAVPQPGRYLQTNNVPLWEIVRLAGLQLFDVIWGSDNRKFDNYQGVRGDLFKVHQLLIIGRARLAAKTALANTDPLIPTKAKPAPRMFIVYPVPYYGPLGCVNQWLNDACTYVMMMCSEAMMHSDNERAFFITKDCHDILYGYLKYLLVDMAVKFFGIDPKAASDDAFTIPDAAWAAFDPSRFSVSSETTSTRPPMGWTATDLDLESIRGLPIEQVIPFLQPWPDSQLKYASGGIWANQGTPAGTQSVGAGQAGGATVAAVNAALYAKPGPPSA